ncbi:hypothetical protein [Faecalibacillus intestinalis]|jgi:hypothetical protein|uniref:hypothetical protein n=1 Tax=Faecalibacillus intestinalis TaxID=1982626 RepID=UPI00351FE72E
MRLTQKAQVTLFGACVASLIFAGTGYAQAKSVEAKKVTALVSSTKKYTSRGRNKNG